MSGIKIPHIEEPSLRAKAFRYFMTIFCLFFTTFGLGVILCSSLIVGQQPKDCLFLGPFYTGVYMLLAAGCTTTFVSLLTCACIQCNSFIGDFTPISVVTGIVIGLQIMAAVACHISYTSATGSSLVSNMHSVWQDYEEDRDCVNNLQEMFGCCGVFNHTEWHGLLRDINSALFPNQTSPVPVLHYPASCTCSSDVAQSHCASVSDSFSNISHSHFIHNRSCHEALLNKLEETLLIPRIVGPVFSFVELLVLLAVAYFLHHIHNHSLVGAYIVGPVRNSDSTGRDPGTSSPQLQATQSAVQNNHAYSQDLFSFTHNESIVHV